MFVPVILPTIQEENDEAMRSRLLREWAARHADWQERQSAAAQRAKIREDTMLQEIFPKEFLDDWLPVFTIPSEDS
jgi:hypothetical protein